MQYDGAYRDSETGNLYLINRFYDPATAQFLNVDPMVGLTDQRYSYAADNPVNNRDPSGLFCYRMQSTSEYGPPNCPNSLPPDPNNPLEVWTPQQAWTPLLPCDPQLTPQQQLGVWLYSGGASSPQFKAQQGWDAYVGNYPPAPAVNDPLSGWINYQLSGRGIAGHLIGLSFKLSCNAFAIAASEGDLSTSSSAICTGIALGIQYGWKKISGG